MRRKALSETFDTLGLKAPDEQPMAQVLQTKASLSYMFTLTVDNRWQNCEEFGITSHKFCEIFVNLLCKDGRRELIACRIGITYPLPCHTSAPSFFTNVAACSGCCASSNSWTAPAIKRRSPWRQMWSSSSCSSPSSPKRGKIVITSSRHSPINLSTLCLKRLFHECGNTFGRMPFNSLKCCRAFSSFSTMLAVCRGSTARERTISALL